MTNGQYIDALPLELKQYEIERIFTEHGGVMSIAEVEEWLAQEKTDPTIVEPINGGEQMQINL